MSESNNFNLQKDLFYQTNPNGSEEDFYAQPEIKKYTKEYQDRIVQLGEDKFHQYQYKVEFPKEDRYLIVNTDYKIPEDGSRNLTQKYGGLENCYVSYIGRINLSGIRQLVADCEASRSYKTTGMATFPLGKILQFGVIALAIYLAYKFFL
jgi:hypothetical protein